MGGWGRGGFTVALIGPDGSGKSTVARALVDSLGRAGVPCRSLYMGVNADESNRLLPTSRVARRLKQASSPTRPSPGRRTSVRSQPGSTLRTVLRLVNRVAEEWYRQAVAWRATKRGEVVVFDRHFLADYHASDIARPGRSLDRRVHGWLLQRTYPRPDVTVFLDAPGAVLHSRKGEGTPAWLDQRRREYLALAADLPDFNVVDATAPAVDVTAAVEAIVLARRAGGGTR